MPRLLRPLLLAAALLATVAAAAPEPDTWGEVEVTLSDHFDGEQVATWRARENEHRTLTLAQTPVSLSFYLILLFTPVGAWLWRTAKRLAERVPSRGGEDGPPSVPAKMFGEDWVASLFYTWGYLLLGAALLLPFSLVREYWDQADGLSNYSALGWIWDLVKGQLMATVILSMVVFGVFGLVRRLPNRWWLALGVPAVAVLLAWGLVSPYRARLFHDFRPLDDGPLKTRLVELARGEGLDLTAIKVVEASRTTKTLNAYITGTGPSRELVLYDNLVNRDDDDLVVAVVAHELGHERQERPVRAALLSGLVMLVMLAGVAWLLRWGAGRLGYEGPGDVRNLPLVMLAVTLCFLVARPTRLAMSRAEEREADRIGLTLTGDAEAVVRLWVVLAEVNQADPAPPAWANFWFGSHPPIVERIGVARWYGGWLRESQGAGHETAGGE